MKKLTVVFFSLFFAVVALAQPAPPGSLTGSDLRLWYRNNWYNGYHTQLDYNTALNRVFSYVDNSANSLKCLYSNFNKTWVYGGSGVNPSPIVAEHLVPKSFFNSQLPLYSDLHNLYPAYNSWQTLRDGAKFGDIADAQTQIWMRTSIQQTTIPTTLINEYAEYTAANGGMFEPRELVKGDIARAIFYFFTMYEGNTNLSGKTIADVADINTLYAWHLADPVSQTEIDRNNSVASYQGNKNPYIEHPTTVAKAFNIAVCNSTPTTQVTNLTVGMVTSGSAKISFTLGNGNARLVVIKEGSAVAFTPNTNYTGIDSNYQNATTQFAGHKIIYAGAGNSFTVIGLQPNTVYHIKAFEYCSNGPHYLLTNAPANNFTTAGCSAPVSQTFNLSASGIGENSATISLSKGDGYGRIVKINTANTFTDPTANTSYSANNVYASGEQVVYNGTGTSFSVSGLTANTTYYVKAYEYNCPGGSEVYNVSASGNSGLFTTSAPCSAPLLQSDSIYFNAFTHNSVDVSWRSGNGIGRIVMASPDSNFNLPTNGTIYPAIAFYTGPNDQVVYNGTGSNVAVNGLQPNTTYYFRVFDFNCPTVPKFNMARAKLNHNHITTASTPLSVNFSAPITTGSAPLSVVFKSQLSGGTAPFTYRWDFNNDGTYDATNTNDSATNNYTSAGIYSVKLRVDDATGKRDSITKNNYITVTTASSVNCLPDLIFSEYVEGTSNNKALEIYNGTGASVNLSLYSLAKDANGNNTFSTTVNLSGTLANDKTYVIVNKFSSATLVAKADLTNGKVLAFNGNDQVRLMKGTTEIDRIGINQSSDWAKDVTLVRKSNVLQGKTTPSNPTTNGEWTIIAVDVYDNLGSHTVVCSGGGTGFVPAKPSTTGDTVCSGNTATLSAAGSPNANWLYKWYSDSSSASSLFTGASFTTPSLTAAATYWVALDSAGVQSARAKVLVLVKMSSASTSNISICQGDSIMFGTTKIKSAGTYIRVIPNQAGCDSTITLTVSLKPTSTFSYSASICQGDSIMFGTTKIKSSGTYLRVLPNQAGCDSTITLTVSVKPSSSISYMASICQGDSIMFGTTKIKSAGTYIRVLPNQAGCDSTITLTVSVTSIDTTISQIGDTLFSLENIPTIVKWVNCTSLDTLATGKKFKATVSGNYKAVFFKGNCREVSGCRNVTITNLAVKSDDFFKVIPNPIRNHTDVRVVLSEIPLKIQLVGLDGKILEERSNLTLDNTFSIEKLSSGIYLFRVITHEFVYHQKFIIQ